MFQAALPGSRGEAYLQQRGIPLALAQQHGVGYAPPGTWPHAARDWWGGRVVCPHTTPDGSLVNLYGRAVGTAAQVPKAKRHDHLPGAKGYFNAAALHPVVYPHTAATATDPKSDTMAPYDTIMRGVAMIPHHVYYQLAIVGLLWLCVMLHYIWPSRGAVSPQPPVQPVPPPLTRKRSNEPKPFVGLTQRPSCALCEYDANHPEPPPPRRPDPMAPPKRRPCAIDTSWHFCPHAGCDYQGWLGLGNLRANGHPSGGLWRQLYWRSCHGYFLETHGTLFHGKRLSVELSIRVLTCLAEGLGIRATARVFEVDPNTVLPWLLEAAEHLQAFTRYVLCDVHVTQLQLDELSTVIRALKTGQISPGDALECLEPRRPWVWTAIDPVSKLLLAIEVGPRTVEMAQRVVHRVGQRLASGCVPTWVSDGFKGYLPAIVGHFGLWMQPAAPPGQRPVAQAPLAAAAWSALCAGRQAVLT